MKWRTAVGAQLACDETAGCPGSTLEYAREWKQVGIEAQPCAYERREPVKQRDSQRAPPNYEGIHDRVRFRHRRDVAGIEDAHVDEQAAVSILGQASQLMHVRHGNSCIR